MARGVNHGRDAALGHWRSVFLDAEYAVDRKERSCEGKTMAGLIDEAIEWRGRELFDAGNEKIGTIAGLGYPRKKFGATWLLVETAAGTVLVPAEQIHPSPDRLVLPYPRTYVEGSPTLEQDQPLSRAEERLLCLHYGLDSVMPNSGCRQGCGLCQARRRAKRLS